MAPRIGLIISAGDFPDPAGLAAKLAKFRGITGTKILDDPMSPAALADVAETVKSGRADRLLWAGRFGPEQRGRLLAELSQAGLNPYLQTFVDPSGPAGLAPQTLQKRAQALILMALAGLRLAEPLEPVEVPAEPAALVVGGGVAGLNAALALAEVGKRVHLVERRDAVGGTVARLSRFYPLMCDPACGLAFTLDSIARTGRVEMLTRSELTALSGAPGRFQAGILVNPTYVHPLKCNSCGACQAACPMETPLALDFIQDEPPLAESRTGITGLVKAKSKAIHPARPLGRPAAFVVDRRLCPPGCRECALACPAKAVDLDQAPREVSLMVGAVILATGFAPYPLSRLTEFGYGRLSRVVGNLEMEALLSAAAGQIKAEVPALADLKAVAFVQCAGSRDQRHLKYCSSVCCSASLKQVLQLKEINPDLRCYVFYQDIRTLGFEEELYQRVRDLPGVVFIRGLPAVEGIPGHEKVLVRAEDTFSGQEVRLELDLLVLAGGLRPALGAEALAERLNLPLNEFGFFRTHRQCRPEDPERSGIYVAGGCQEPMAAGEAIASGHLAALKGLKFMTGPVKVAPTFPVLDQTRCDKCKRCLEECPFQAYDLDERTGFPVLNLTRCRHCGNCLGVCPLGAISLKHLTLKQLSAGVEALGENLNLLTGPREPVVLAFLCQNDAAQAARLALDQGLPVPPNVVTIEVPCAGAVNNALVADALSLGLDGVLIAGCLKGQCHFLKGSDLVEKRRGDLADKLKQMMIEPERVRFERLEVRAARKYVDVLRDYLAGLRKLGPSPFRI